MKPKFIIYILTAMLVISSCAKLEEEPYGFLASDNYYTTEKNVRSGLFYAYTTLYQFEYFWGWWRFNELPARVTMVKGNDHSKPRFLPFMAWSVEPNTGDINSFFQFSYKGIFRANTVLDNAEGLEFEDESVRDQYMGEAKFLRAWFYFNLVKIYGEVPVYTNAQDPGDAFDTPVSSIEDVYNLIIEDLEYAEANIPEFKIAGRADKTSAQALLVKVYMHMASSKEFGSPRYDWVSSHTEMYENAVSYANEVTASGAYGLDASVYETFPDNRNLSNEKLFVLANDYEGDEVGHVRINWSMAPYVGFDDDYYAKIPGTETIRGYKPGYAVFWYNEMYYNSHEEGDLRLDLYADEVYTDEAGLEITNDTVYNHKTYWNMKYATEKGDFYAGTATMHFLRMSDIVLLQAEALGRLDRVDEGLPLVNQLRTRAGLNPLSSMSKDDFDKAVWQERLWELNGEGHLMTDLRRRHAVESFIAEDDLKNSQLPIDRQYSVPNRGGELRYQYFYPLPQREIDLNTAIEADPEKATLK